MKRKAMSMLLAVAIGGLLLNTAASRTIQSTAKQTSQVAPVTIPFELANRHIMLKVKVNDSRPLSFVLDTGDQYAIINLDRAKELGLKLQGQVRMGGAGAGLSIGSFVKEATFTIPGFAGFSQPLAMALPIGNFAQRLGQDFDGIIGSEFIKEFVVEIDYLSQTLKLHDRDKFVYHGSGESVPIQLDPHGHPLVEAEVTPTNGQPIKGRFVIDIGSGLALALYSPFVAEHKLLGPTRKTIRALGGAGAGGAVYGRIGRVAELKLGKYRLPNIITMFSEDKAGAFASSALAGNIGARITGKFKVFLDYSRKRIILEPNSSFDDGIDRAFSGISLQAEGADYRTFRITAILEDSPASEIGLQRDDVITAIDGRPATELTLSKLNAMFERTASYALTVKRGEQILKLKLTPRKLV